MSALDLKLMLMNSGGDGGFVPPPPADYITFISGPFVSDGVSTTDVSATCTHSAGHAVNHYYGIYQNSSPTDEQLIAGTGNGLIYHNSSIGVASGAEEAHSFPKVNFDTIYRLEWLCEEPTKARTRALYVEFSISNPNERAPEWSDVPDFYSIQGVPGSGGEVPATQEQAGALSAESGGVDMNPYVDFFGSSTQSWEASPTNRVDITQDGILSGDVDAPVGVYTVTVTAISEHGVSPKDMTWEVLDPNGWVVDFTDSPLDLKGLEYNSTSETFKDCLSEDKTVYGTTPALVGRSWSGVAYSSKGVDYGIHIEDHSCDLYGSFGNLYGLPDAVANNYTMRASFRISKSLADIWTDNAGEWGHALEVFHNDDNINAVQILQTSATNLTARLKTDDNTNDRMLVFTVGAVPAGTLFDFRLRKSDTDDNGDNGWWGQCRVDGGVPIEVSAVNDCTAPHALGPLNRVSIGSPANNDPTQRIPGDYQYIQIEARALDKATIEGWDTWTEPTPVLADPNIQPPYIHVGGGGAPGIVYLNDQLVSILQENDWDQQYASGLKGGAAAIFTLGDEVGEGPYVWEAETTYGGGVWVPAEQRVTVIGQTDGTVITVQPAAPSESCRIRCLVNGNFTRTAYLAVKSDSSADETQPNDFATINNCLFFATSDRTFQNTGWDRDTNLCAPGPVIISGAEKDNILTAVGQVECCSRYPCNNARGALVFGLEYPVGTARFEHTLQTPDPLASGVSVFIAEHRIDPDGTSFNITTSGGVHRVKVSRMANGTTYGVTMNGEAQQDTGIELEIDSIAMVGVAITGNSTAGTFYKMNWKGAVQSAPLSALGENADNVATISFMNDPVVSDPLLGTSCAYSAFTRHLNETEATMAMHFMRWRAIWGQMWVNSSGKYYSRP